VKILKQVGFEDERIKNISIVSVSIINGRVFMRR
jgi:hypothetical protein